MDLDGFRRFRRWLALTIVVLIISTTVILAFCVKKTNEEVEIIDDADEEQDSQNALIIFYLVQICIVLICTASIGFGLIYTLKRRFYLFYKVIKKQIYCMLTVQLISELVFSLLLFLQIVVKPIFISIYQLLTKYSIANSLYILATALIYELLPLSSVMYSLWFSIREKERALSVRFSTPLEVDITKQSAYWSDFRMSIEEKH